MNPMKNRKEFMFLLSFMFSCQNPNSSRMSMRPELFY
jgi:hypothetical protein